MTSRGTVDGKPVAYVKPRSTYFHEVDSARGVRRLQRPGQGATARRTSSRRRRRSATPSTGSTWTTSTSATSTRATTRCAPQGVDPNFPNWGTGSSTGRASTRPAQHRRDHHALRSTRRSIDQNYITSWNNKQAPGYRAADDNWGYGPIYRSQLLDERVKPRITRQAQDELAELIDAMEDAGTVDLRGDACCRCVLKRDRQAERPAAGEAAVAEARAPGRRPARTASTGTGTASTSTRDAIRIMDAWWPRAGRGRVQARRWAPDLFDDDQGACCRSTTPPNNDGAHLGSAYQDGWYGYVVEGPAAGPRQAR